MSRTRTRGMGLVELLVAMVIGCVLVAAALTVYAQSRSAGRSNESVARLQEHGRYALSVIEADVALAGLYGFGNSPESIRLVSGGDASAFLAAAADLQQTQPPVSGLPPGAHACGTNFAVDLLAPVEGANGSFDLACAPYASGARANTDTLIVRRADTKDSLPESGRLQIFTSRLSILTGQLLFSDGASPGAVDADHAIRNLIVRAFYIANDSVSRPNFPALRVKSMTRSGGNMVFDEDEVITGIEDLQVQFGIDTGDYDNDGAVDPQADLDRDGVAEPNGRATRYVSPDFANLSRYQVAAVRIWVRVRADEPELGFVDGRTYRYADVVYRPTAGERAYRRALMSRTVAVRNALFH